MVVIDASIAAKWYLLESGREAARVLLLSGEPLVAPELIIAEVMNVLWKKVRIGQIAPNQVALSLNSLIGAFAQLAPSVPLANPAAEIALLLDHPIYDLLLSGTGRTRAMCIDHCR